MRKFKVGDKVRCVGDAWGIHERYKVGDVHEITSIGDIRGQCYYRINGDASGFGDARFELVTEAKQKFEVGDRVPLLKDVWVELATERPPTVDEPTQEQTVEEPTYCQYATKQPVLRNDGSPLVGISRGEYIDRVHRIAHDVERPRSVVYKEEVARLRKEVALLREYPICKFHGLTVDLAVCRNNDVEYLTANFLCWKCSKKANGVDET